MYKLEKVERAVDANGRVRLMVRLTSDNHMSDERIDGALSVLQATSHIRIEDEEQDVVIIVRDLGIPAEEQQFLADLHSVKLLEA